MRLLSLLLLLLPAVGLRAGDGDVYSARRERLMARISGGVALLQGAPEPRSYKRFRQANDFYYLSGAEAPGAFLLIDAAEKRSILFLPAREPSRERWDGPRLYPGEAAKAVTGCEEILEASRFEAELEKRKNRLRAVYTPMMAEELAMTSRDRAQAFDAARERSAWDGRISRARAFVESLQKKLGEKVEIKDLSPTLDDMRRVKDAHEIELLRESARIGAAGLREAMRATQPGRYEYQIAAAAEFVFGWRGAMGPAYSAIVGSGPNSCFLHYMENNRRVEEGDIIVMDFGPDYRYYHSDITRTFPASGKFSIEQAKLYQIVLEAQKAALAKVRPGASMGEINSEAREIAARFGYGGNWVHGVTHYVGMSTHDVGSSRALEPGVVLTVEPGIYLPEKRLGVRIEDTVLVTREGCEVLSRDVPKEVSEIERLMASKGPINP